MKRLLCVAACALTPWYALASWQIENDVDAMSDRVTAVATTTNGDGHSVSIYQRDDGSVWMNFRVSDASFDLLSPKIAPMFRVDGRKAHSLDDVKRLQELVPSFPKGYFWEPKWINVRIWDGWARQKGRSHELIDLMAGERVVFRYYLSTGGAKDTVFDLTGAEEAIAVAAGLRGEIEAMEGAERLTAAVASARKACEANAVNEDYSVCAARYERCMEATAGNIEAFEACAAEQAAE